MPATIASPKMKAVVSALYEDSARNRPSGPPPSSLPNAKLDERARFEQMPDVYMAIAPEFGHLLYSIVRTTRADRNCPCALSDRLSSHRPAGRVHRLWTGACDRRVGQKYRQEGQLGYAGQRAVDCRPATRG